MEIRIRVSQSDVVDGQSSDLSRRGFDAKQIAQIDRRLDELVSAHLDACRFLAEEIEQAAVDLAGGGVNLTETTLRSFAQERLRIEVLNPNA